MLKLIGVLLFIFCWSNIAYTAKYYVNDNSTTGDVFCSAVGSNTTGTGTSLLPYATFNKLWNVRQGVFSNNDTIFVDAGTYTSYSGGDGFGKNCGYTIQVKLCIKGAGINKTIFDNQNLTTSYVGNGNSAPSNGSFSYFGVFTGSSAGASIMNISFKKYTYGITAYGQCFSINGLSTSTSPISFINVGISESQTATTGNGGTAAIVLYSAGNITNKIVFSGGVYNCNGDASHNGGFIDVFGATNLGSSPNVKVTLSNVAVIGNNKFSNPQYKTGAISMTGAYATDSLTISNCLFDGNTCTYNNVGATGGSAIYITTTTGTPKISISNTIFKNGSMSGASISTYGGVCYFAVGTVTISGCSFENNTFSSGTIKGVLASNTASLTISNSYFTGNSANTANDIHMQGAGTVSVSNTTFSSSATNLSRVAGTFTVTNSGTPSSTGTITISGTSPSAFSSPSVPSYTGDCSSLNIVLPIELISFEAKKTENYNLITWKTAAEIDNDFFTVFKSFDGQNFEVLGYVKGAGNSTIENSYSLVDRDKVEGIVYYQLKQTNYNGESHFSDLISVDNQIASQATILKITNLLGQEVSKNESGILIYYYSDGTNIKIIQN